MRLSQVHLGIVRGERSMSLRLLVIAIARASLCATASETRTLLNVERPGYLVKV